MPLIVCLAVISRQLRVAGKCHRDVWHGTDRVTFVVNQPLVHPKLFFFSSLLPHTNTDDCRRRWSVLHRDSQVSQEVDQ